MAPLLFLLALAWGMVLRSWSGTAEVPYAFLVGAIQAGCWVFFRAKDPAVLFASFEGVGISTFLLIGFFGARERRHVAGLHFLGYTLVASLAFLVTWLESASRGEIPGAGSDLWVRSPGVALALIAAFCFKLPAVPFHSWLPRAHVEAPLGGSVVLAAVLLKLGAHGLAWVGLGGLTSGATFSLAFFGLGVGAFLTLRQTEAKKLVACSSLGHMASILAAFSLDRPDAAYLIAVTHGTASPLLFFWATSAGDRLGGRDLVFWRGFAAAVPLFSGFLLLCQALSWGMPPAGAFLGELSFASGVASLDGTLLLASLGLAAVGRLALLVWHVRTAGGTLPPGVAYFRDLSRGEAFFLVFWATISAFAGVALRSFAP